MQSSWDPASPARPPFSSTAPAHRRRYYRQKLGSLAYVNLDHTNGGILRDVSEAGIALQAVAPVRAGQRVQLRLDLSPRLHIETVGRVAWTSPLGGAGIEFSTPSERVRRLLQQWLFTRLLIRAHQVFAADSIFAIDRQADQAPELHFSAKCRPPIRLDVAPNRKGETAAGTVSLGWLPVSISLRGLARLVDGLALVAAVLLFSVVALGMVRVLPSATLALGVLLAATGLLAILYWLIFSFSMGQSPGSRLAGLYKRDLQKREEDRPRFR